MFGQAILVFLEHAAKPSYPGHLNRFRPAKDALPTGSLAEMGAVQVDSLPAWSTCSAS